MDSLESKLERLPPVQRQEIEDFVEFLLQRSASNIPSSYPAPGLTPPSNVAPPAFTVHEPALPIESVPQPHEIRASEPVHEQQEQASTGIEILTSAEDLIARDYMDYGQFDRKTLPSSPAIEAVKNVKVKLGQKQKLEPANNILEWID